MDFFSHTLATLWTVLFFSYISTIDCRGVSCYRCTVAPNPGAKFSSSQICSHFEESQRFQTYCPNSTLCMKRSTKHLLGNGTLVVTSVERGCAPQLHVSQAYDFEKKSWYTKQEVVTSAYEERCFTGEDRGSPGGPPEYCFCRFDLCNGSNPQIIMYKLTCVLLLLLFFIQRIIN